MQLIDYLLSSIVFWAAWAIIPLIFEIIPAVGNFFLLLAKKIRTKKSEPLCYLPEITLIIPVYNSEDTLRACIKSVYDSNYKKELIYLLLVNNQGKDDSFEIFSHCQEEFPELNMNWMNAKQGKSKALNTALYNSAGKYIIHIDSDGVLHEDALLNMVTMFEQDKDTDCLTGTIMTNPEMVQSTKGFFKRILCKLEFFEYCQAFLAGRNFEAESNSIYTLSGAFSAFRKSTILKTKLYNTDTVCEDTHVTFQVRDVLKKKVKICTNAIFFVDPISGLNELYTQRQRWQRGELEVAHMFHKRKRSSILERERKGRYKDLSIRLLFFDHTFAFPRMIWYFALLCLAYLNYPVRLIIVCMGVIILLYMFNSMLFYINILMFLREYKELQHYYMKKWYCIFITPVYKFVLFWFRFAGIINSIRTEQTWRTQNLTEEREAILQTMKRDFSFLFPWKKRG